MHGDHSVVIYEQHVFQQQLNIKCVLVYVLTGIKLLHWHGIMAATAVANSWIFTTYLVFVVCKHVLSNIPLFGLHQICVEPKSTSGYGNCCSHA